VVGGERREGLKCFMDEVWVQCSDGQAKFCGEVQVCCVVLCCW
jgi:hypothetical protein